MGWGMAKSKGNQLRTRKRLILLLKSKIKMLEEQISAQKMALAIEGPKIERQMEERRFFHGNLTPMMVGIIHYPLPAGWEVNTGGDSFGTVALTVENHGQKYAEVKVIKPA